MARDGSGTYTNPYPNFIAGTVISSDQTDANNSDIAAALTQSIAVDGQSTVTANLPMNSKKLTGMAVGTAATDSLTLGQAQAQAFAWCGTAGGGADAITISPTPAITAYAAGQKFFWIASGSANTGAATIAISGLSAIAMQDGGAALAAGVHAAGKVFMGVLNTTSTMQIMQVQSSGDPLTISALTVNGASQFNGTIIQGVDGTGYDLKLFGDTSGAYIMWDQSADKLLTAGGALVDIVKDKLMIGGTAVTTTAAELNFNDTATAGTVVASKTVVASADKDIASFRNITLTGELDAGSLDVSGAVDIAGTTNLDAVDIDGNVQVDGTLTVGVDGTGYDVKLFGDTSGAHVLWDQSEDKLLTAGGALVDVVKDKLMIGGTAVTTTAAELNFNDTATAGTVVASKTVVASADKDIASFRNITLTGELDAGSLDVSGGADIAGQTTIQNGSAGAPSLAASADTNTGLYYPAGDTLGVSVAGALDFQFEANDFTALSGSVISTNTIAETTADTGVTIDGLLIKDGSLALSDLNLPAVSGIIESNANFVDMCLVGPSVDGMSWNGHFSKASVWTSLMLATVETSGSDAQVNIWDLAASTLASATPLATLTLSGATPTSIAASMGYLIVGTSDQGFHIVDPHTGAWAERTEGALQTLSTSTAPALADNNVFDVAIQMPNNGSPQDPNTGGLVPFISWTYGASADECGVLSNGAVYNKTEGTATDNVTAIDAFGHVYTTNNSSDYGRKSNVPIYQIAADDWGTSIFFDGSGGAGPTFTGAQGDANSISLGPDGKIVTATDAGLNYGYTHASYPGSNLAGYVNRTFTTGYLGQGCVLAGLANSDTADRSGNSHNLTEEGTVAEVTIASGAELKGYRFATANYLKTPVADAAFEMGTSGFTASVWVYSESDPGNAGIMYYRHAGTGATPQWGFFHNSSQQVFATVNDGSDSITITSNVSIIDSKPHLLSMVFNGTTKELSFFIDGALQGSGIDTDVGTLSGGSGFAVGIGNIPEGGAFAWDGTNSWMALARIMQSTVLGTEDQFLRMYRDELPLFSANAKCLLQSGSTDIVLDAAVDPLTGKVIVTQTDSQDIFDGLVIETERTVATGGSTFEHGLLFGDAVAEINNANLFASTPATDQRQVNEMVRSMSADVPAGIDLGKAKAWIKFEGAAGKYIHSSFNIKKVVVNGTGDFQIHFEVPFKTNEYVSTICHETYVGTARTLNASNKFARALTYNTSNALADCDDIQMLFFGELENE